MSAINNAKWVTFSQAGKIALQFIGLALLSRLVPVEDFGVMAMAVTVTNFASLFRDLGTAAAVIQRDELSEDLKSSIFWMNFFIGLFICLLLIFMSPVLSHWFRQPKLGDVLFLVAFSFPIASSSAVHQALLERESKFRVLAFSEIGSSLIALSAAVFFALSGYGVFALVAQTLVSIVVSSVALWFISGWIPKKRFDLNEVSSIFKFSGNLSLFNFVNYFARNADVMIIARFCNAAQLGGYSMAYRVMLFPLQSMTFVSSRALFPVLSRKQSDVREMGRTYLGSVRVISGVTAPMMCGLWFLREPFVQIVLGAQWGSVSDLLAWLAPVGYIQSIVSTTGTTFMATGHTSTLFRLGVLGAVLQVGAFFLGVNWGVEGVVICYLVATGINAFPALTCALAQFQMSLKDILFVLWPSVLCAVIMAVGLQCLQVVGLDKVLQGRLSFFFMVISGVAIYSFSICIFFKEDVSALLLMLRRNRGASE